jgi:hypothetical protein
MRVGRGQAGRPELVQKGHDPGRGLGHVLLEDVVGVGLVAEKLGPLGPEGGDLGRDGLVVGVVAVVAPVDEGGEELLPEVSPGGILEEGDAARLVEGEDPLPLAQVASLGRFGGALDDGLGQAGQLLGLVQDEDEAVVLLEDVLAELLGQDGELLVDRPELRLLGLVEVGPAADEELVGLVQELGLLRGQGELVLALPDGLDPGEELRVEVDVVLVLGQERGDRRLDLLHLLVGVGRGQVEEDVRHLGQEGPALLQGLDGVGEGRRLGIAVDGGDLLLLAGHPGFESGHIMGRLDPVEGRRFEGGGPGEEEGILRRRRRRRRGLLLRAGHGEEGHDGQEDGENSHVGLLAAVSVGREYSSPESGGCPRIRPGSWPRPTARGGKD